MFNKLLMYFQQNLPCKNIFLTNKNQTPKRNIFLNFAPNSFISTLLLLVIICNGFLIQYSEAYPNYPQPANTATSLYLRFRKGSLTDRKFKLYFLINLIILEEYVQPFIRFRKSENLRPLLYYRLNQFDPSAFLRNLETIET